MRTILVSAYACEPYKGSEQTVGWNIVLELAKNNIVHVITRANNQEPIEKFLKEKKKTNLKFHYYDTPKIFLSLKNKEKGVYLYYILWQIGIISLASKLKKLHHFDYSIHLTFGNVWLPTFLPFINIPFIYGPLGGGEGIPDTFINKLPIKRRIIQRFRKLLKITACINPLFLYTSSKCKAILCRTKDTANLFPEKYQSRINLLEDGAIEPEIFDYHASHKKQYEVKIISTSRLIAFKNVISIVEALEYVPSSYKINCIIIGSGSEKLKIQKLSTESSHHIIFKERLSRNDVLQELSNSDIFISPSLRDACNLSLLEAMAVGLPVICLNWSGMAISTDDSCAIRLPVTNPEQMPKDMAAAIIKLIENPELRKRMGDAGRKRIKEVFNWEAKGLFMERLFAELDSKR